MSITYTAIAPVNSSKPRPQLPDGTHTARLISIIDLGTQEQPFKNKDGSPKFPERLFLITFETPTQKAIFSEEKGEQPFLISKEIPFKISKEGSEMISNLTKLIKAIKGNLDDLNIFSLVGGLCSISTEINEKCYAQIKTFAPLSSDLDKESSKFKQVNESQLLYLEAPEIDYDVINKQPSFIKDKIITSPEFLKANSSKPASDELPEINVEDFNQEIENAGVAMPF